VTGEFELLRTSLFVSFLNFNFKLFELYNYGFRFLARVVRAALCNSESGSAVPSADTPPAATRRCDRLLQLIAATCCCNDFAMHYQCTGVWVGALQQLLLEQSVCSQYQPVGGKQCIEVARILERM